MFNFANTMNHVCQSFYRQTNSYTQVAESLFAEKGFDATSIRTLQSQNKMCYGLLLFWV
jgi:hypothetical protein